MIADFTLQNMEREMVPLSRPDNWNVVVNGSNISYTSFWWGGLWNTALWNTTLGTSNSNAQFIYTI